MLSRKTKYGIKALVFLAKQEQGKKVQTLAIAESENISHKFLEAIMLTLRKGGFLSAKKGKGGGYYLLKDPNEIWMSDVIRCLEGPIAMLPCVSLNFYEKCDDCPDESTCAINHLMVEVRDSTLAVLKTKSLA
ncbi:MAG: Rrf2 family transcriptional regulator, partial [Crocinitomicaceae bacterium]|nr:Rrf2 family transcriptional regulator [Crocinitomicaceae bacterium]